MRVLSGGTVDALASSMNDVVEVGGMTPEEAFPDSRVAALARAACEGDRDRVGNLVRSGADPNGLGFQGVTPLLWAIRFENLAGIEALLEAGADPDLRPPDSFSATYAASTFDSPAMLRLLLSAGGDPNAADPGGRRTALNEALTVGIRCGQWDSFHLLLEAGADVNKVMGRRNTIARMAAALNQYDKVLELLERGYSHDLESLESLVRSDSSDLLGDQGEWRRKVLEHLQRSRTN